MSRIIGGRAEIQEVQIDGKFVWIVFKLFPDSPYNWAHARPDLMPEFNE